MRKLYDPMSKKPFFMVDKTELNSITLNSLPIHWDTVTKNIAESRYGTTILSSENVPILFKDASIDTVLNLAISQNILSTKEAHEVQELKHELFVIMEDGHFKAVLQNNDRYDPWHSTFNFYPGEEDDAKKEQIIASLASLGQICQLESNPVECIPSQYNYDKHHVKEQFSQIIHIEKYVEDFTITFKLTDKQFNAVIEKMEDIHNGCNAGTIKYISTPALSENALMNCFTSIQYLTTAANIKAPYLSYFPDTILKSNSAFYANYFYLYNNRDTASIIDKVELFLAENVEKILPVSFLGVGIIWY